MLCCDCTKQLTAVASMAPPTPMAIPTGTQYDIVSWGCRGFRVVFPNYDRVRPRWVIISHKKPDDEWVLAGSSINTSGLNK